PHAPRRAGPRPAGRAAALRHPPLRRRGGLGRPARDARRAPLRRRPAVRRRRPALSALARRHALRRAEARVRVTACQLRRAAGDDVAAIMELERATFATDAWSERSMLTEVTGEHGYYLVAFPPGHPERIDAYAGLLAPCGAGEGDIQTIA